MISKKAQNKLMRIFREYDVDENLLDWKSEWDNGLQDNENLKHLRGLIETLSSSKDNGEKIQADKKVKKLSIKHEKESIDKFNQEIFRKEEKITQKEFNDAIDKILKKDDSRIEKYFKSAKHYIKMISKGISNGLILKSNAGLGKTFLVLKTLKEEKTDFAYINGYSTNLSFYEYLYNNKDKEVLVFDDFSGVLDNSVGISILKSAIWSVTDKRVLNYLTTSDKISVPSQFTLNARVIFCLNNTKGFNADSRALQNRALFYELNFSYKDIIKIIMEIAKQPYKDMTKEERFEVAKYVKDITDETTRDLNFRTLIKSFDIFIYSKKYNNGEWKNLIKDLIETDEDLLLVKKLIESEPTTKIMVEKFCEQTGKSRATFFRLKKKLSQSLIKKGCET